MSVTLQHGLSDAQRHAAATLYWQAFGGKLDRVMGPEAVALRFLVRVIRADHAIAALDEDGRLLGIAGFKTQKGGFAGGSFADMQAVYGIWGGAWRAGLLRLLQGDVDNDRFLLDGICVAREARSRGIGTALLAEIFDEAARRGYSSVRLDVIDSNWRARALYERMGFVAVRTQGIGALKHVFGFSSAITMVRMI